MSARRVLLVVVLLAPLAAACGNDGGGFDSSASTTTTRPADAKEVPDSRLPGPGAFMGPVYRVPVNGIEIGYRQFGQGDDLVLITGDTGTMSLWLTTFPERLSKHFRVTMFDNRGVGYSTDDTSVPMTVPLMAKDTADLITALGLDKPAALGWSMGGEIGLTMTVNHPDSMRALVSTGGDFGGPHAIQESAEIEAALNDPDTPTVEFLDFIFPDNPQGQAASQRFSEEYISIPQEQESTATDIRQGEAETAWYDDNRTYRGLPDVTIPVLITNGGDDIVNPVENARLIQERLAKSSGMRREIFDGAGHGMWFQNEKEFVDLVVEFLGS
jgi:pimeloyl-ACP methyl ester carboxylesterase